MLIATLRLGKYILDLYWVYLSANVRIIYDLYISAMQSLKEFNRSIDIETSQTEM